MCPECNSTKTEVLNKWQATKRELLKFLGAYPRGGGMKRRRKCLECGTIYTTTEVILRTPQ